MVLGHFDDGVESNEVRVNHTEVVVVLTDRHILHILQRNHSEKGGRDGWMDGCMYVCGYVCMYVWVLNQEER